MLFLPTFVIMEHLTEFGFPWYAWMIGTLSDAFLIAWLDRAIPLRRVKAKPKDK